MSQQVNGVYIVSSIITFMLGAASINHLDHSTLACVHLIASFKTCRQSGLGAQQPERDRVPSALGILERLLHRNNL